jgi:hypothetical protein
MSSRVRRIGARRCEPKLIDPEARPVAERLERFFLLKPPLNASFFGASGVEREARSLSAASYLDRRPGSYDLGAPTGSRYVKLQHQDALP